MPAPVAQVFETFAPEPRRKLKALRRLIFETGASLDGVGPLQETLRWGEPAYLTAQSKSGSTIRLGWKATRPDHYFLYVHCQTSLIDSFRERFGDELVLEGTRAIVFDIHRPLREDVVAQCIAAALTYHWDKPRTRTSPQSPTAPNRSTESQPERRPMQARRR